jgi:hypothetical protein
MSMQVSAVRPGFMLEVGEDPAARHRAEALVAERRAAYDRHQDELREQRAAADKLKARNPDPGSRPSPLLHASM